MSANNAAAPGIRLSGPGLSATAGCGKPRVRDRIFQTACDLFYKHGIREVGVDTIATEAGNHSTFALSP